MLDASSRSECREAPVAVTIADVAKAAGVSTSTVSRALSRADRVDEQTRARIMEQVLRLGYQPNRAARSLTTGRTGNLGVIVPDLANPFFPDVVKAIGARAHQRSLTTLLADAGEDPVTEMEMATALAPQVDGIVLCGATVTDAEVAALTESVPVLTINRVCPGIPSIAVDNAGGTRQAIRHLRALGHRRIGYVGGPESSWSHRHRLAGCRSAAAEYELELVELGSFAASVEGGESAADAVLLAEVTGVAAYNDVIAIGLMHRLHGYGMRVPEDISVVGFDDILLARMSYPPLTTVRFPRAEAGHLAVDRILDAIESNAPPADPSPLPTELVVRGSTARSQLTV
jgi:DNA-binding LacI/PurR family transcriptional regulator